MCMSVSSNICLHKFFLVKNQVTHCILIHKLTFSPNVLDNLQVLILQKKNTSLCPIFVDLTLSLCEASIVFCRLHVPGSPCSGATAPSPQIAPRFIQGPSSQTMRMKLLEFFRIPSWWSAALKSHPGGEPGPGSIS